MSAEVRLSAQDLIELAERSEAPHPHLCGQGISTGAGWPGPNSIISANAARRLGAQLFLVAAEADSIQGYAEKQGL